MSTTTATDDRSPAELAREAEHGRCTSILTTHVNTRHQGVIVVSTVVLASGFADPGGAFVTYQSRVFGGRCDGLAEDLHLGGAEAYVGGARVIRHHGEMVAKVAESFE